MIVLAVLISCSADVTEAKNHYSKSADFVADTEISVRLNLNPLNIQEKRHLWEKENVVLMADSVTPFELLFERTKTSILSFTLSKARGL